jgi:hypothetical protein
VWDVSVPAGRRCLDVAAALLRVVATDLDVAATLGLDVAAALALQLSRLSLAASVSSSNGFVTVCPPESVLR